MRGTGIDTYRFGRPDVGIRIGGDRDYAEKGSSLDITVLVGRFRPNCANWGHEYGLTSQNSESEL